MKESIKNITLFSCPRHGTNYFCESINTAKTNPKILMGFEPFEPMNIFITSQTLEKLRNVLEINDIKFSNSEMKEMLILRIKNEKSYFFRICDYYKQLCKIKNSFHYGFKIFYDHFGRPIVKNKISLEEIINNADNIIILNRDNKEFAFSLAHAFSTKKWSLRERNKNKNLNLNEKFISEINKQILEKFNFFEKLKNLIEKNQKKVLIINYDDFEKEGWQEIENFLCIKIKDTIEFKKNKYDYEYFFDKYPSIKKTAEKLQWPKKIKIY